jgi:hypothetical protein
MQWGTGGLDVDGCRIDLGNGDFEAYKEKRESWKSTDGKAYPGLMTSPKIERIETKGRWPANVVLEHRESCQFVGLRRVRCIGHWRDVGKSMASGIIYGGWRDRGIDEGKRLADEDGLEMTEAWDCSTDCPVRDINQQSGITQSGAMKREVEAYVGESVTHFLRGHSGPSNQYEDIGGASRFFKQVKS